MFAASSALLSLMLTANAASTAGEDPTHKPSADGASMGCSSVEEPASRGEPAARDEAERIVLRCDGGQTLVFVDTDDQSSSMMEIMSLEQAGLIDIMLDARANPAELWTALTDESLPRFLHGRRLDEKTISRLQEAIASNITTAPAASEWEYSPYLGGHPFYCDNGFPGDFSALNPAPLQFNLSDVLGAPEPPTLDKTSEVYINEAWFAVCNNTPLGEGATQTGIELALLDPSVSDSWWVKLGCPDVENAGVCSHMGPQEALAIHYWTDAPAGQKLRFSALWKGGDPHEAKLRVGFEMPIVEPAIDY